MAVNVKAKDFYPLEQQAVRRVNCLVMGLSLAEADALPEREYAMLIREWNRRHLDASQLDGPHVDL